MTCRVCHDYGIMRGTDRECPCRRGLTVRNGEGYLGTRPTRDLALQWFHGGTTQEVAQATGVTREELALAIEYEAHRPSEPPA